MDIQEFIDSRDFIDNYLDESEFKLKSPINIDGIFDKIHKTAIEKERANRYSIHKINYYLKNVRYLIRYLLNTEPEIFKKLSKSNIINIMAYLCQDHSFDKDTVTLINLFKDDKIWIKRFLKSNSLRCNINYFKSVDIIIYLFVLSLEYDSLLFRIENLNGILILSENENPLTNKIKKLKKYIKSNNKLKKNKILLERLKLLNKVFKKAIAINDLNSIQNQEHYFNTVEFFDKEYPPIIKYDSDLYIKIELLDTLDFDLLKNL